MEDEDPRVQRTVLDAMVTGGPFPERGVQGFGQVASCQDHRAPSGISLAQEPAESNAKGVGCALTRALARHPFAIGRIDQQKTRVSRWTGLKEIERPQLDACFDSCCRQVRLGGLQSPWVDVSSEDRCVCGGCRDRFVEDLLKRSDVERWQVLELEALA